MDQQLEQGRQWSESFHNLNQKHDQQQEAIQRLINIQAHQGVHIHEMHRKQREQADLLDELRTFSEGVYMSETGYHVNTQARLGYLVGQLPNLHPGITKYEDVKDELSRVERERVEQSHESVRKALEDWKLARANRMRGSTSGQSKSKNGKGAEENEQTNKDKVVGSKIAKAFLLVETLSGDNIVVVFGNYTALSHKLRTLWRIKGGFDLLDVGFDYFLVKFDVAEEREKVLLGGPWMIEENYVAVKPWDQEFRSSENCFGATLVWIRISGLPIWCYQEDAMLRVAAAVGIPVKVDLATKLAERGRYARACVQIDLGLPVTKKILVEGVEYEAEYESLHLICGSCLKFGHDMKVCKTDSNAGGGTNAKVISDVAKQPESSKSKNPVHVEKASFHFGKNLGDETVNVTVPDLVESDLHAVHVDHAQHEDLEGWTQVIRKGKDINIGKSVSVASSGTRHNVHHQQQCETTNGTVRKRPRPNSLQNSPVDKDGASTAAWNVRGASNKMARVHCKNLLGFHCVGIEEAVGHRGGIWFLSSIANASCVVIDQIDQCITVKVSVDHNRPWMAIGDFNEIVAPDESTGAYFSSHRASLLATTLDDCELFDLKVTGRRYTWYRAVQASRNLAKRLDRALVNEAWMSMFPEGYSEILSRLHSDHCPILVRCHGSPRVKGSRPFRFQAAWATHPSYKHVISKAWNQEFGGVTERLKMVQQASLDFNSKIFGNIFVRKNKLEYQIDQIQRRLEVTDVLSLRIKEAELREDYNRLLLQEELFWYQKSREQWVKYGDRNTKFFHLQTLVRRNHNRVHGLYVRDGSWSTDPDILQEEALSFYKNLFGTTEEVEVDCLGDVSMPTLSTEACARLIDPVSFAEVKSAVFSMSPFKAPGPDGFQAYFFKEYWEIVGTEIWNIVRSAFWESS
ncbi:uncharacterized protein LOC130965474 [Arachis stenosperma]|uniref:uncharacterized protein LOC130965474 n=1 Tax=Arachis stenosperma TaxID=217475 RepID=UPI0025ABB985|nr:uncharacterized protein LOC130965474 [Arachis stenosperma]